MQVIVFAFQKVPTLLITLGVLVWYAVHVIKSCCSGLQGNGLVCRETFLA